MRPGRRTLLHVRLSVGLGDTLMLLKSEQETGAMLAGHDLPG
jgi:hypothetical protein